MLPMLFVRRHRARNANPATILRVPRFQENCARRRATRLVSPASFAFHRLDGARSSARLIVPGIFLIHALYLNSKKLEAVPVNSSTESCREFPRAVRGSFARKFSANFQTRWQFHFLRRTISPPLQSPCRAFESFPPAMTD